MNGENENCILLFVKYPVAGQVKTRLAEQLNRDAVVDLYRSFVTDTLTTLENLNAHLEIVFDPPNIEGQFKQWLGEEYWYVPQIGLDLGQRMKNASLQAFNEGFNKVVIIGSDSPDLPAEYLELAFKAFKTNDVVLGPSSDGGYYLIGFVKDKFSPEVFDRICWSTENVFEQTINTLKHSKHKLYVLPLWHDIDTSADLNELIKRNRRTAFNQSETFTSIRRTQGQIAKEGK